MEEEEVEEEEVEEEKKGDEEKVEDGYGGGNSWSETHGISSIVMMVIRRTIDD